MINGKIAFFCCLFAATCMQNHANAAPANDNFAAAAFFDPSGGTESGNNTDATKETGEPKHGGQDGGASVWWYWTAPSSSLAAFSTTGSSFDTVLGIYTGETYPLTLIAENDDENIGAGITTSRARFNAVEGTTYKIAVDGFGGETGDITLTCIPEVIVPENDDLANATGISGTNGTLTATNFDASLEPDETLIIAGGGGHSVWWTWTAPVSGIFKFDTRQSSFDTLLGVFTGSGHPLNLVASNDDASPGLTSEVSFTAAQGTVYYIGVDGYDSAGDIRLTWSWFLPKVQSIVRATDSPTNAASVQYNVTFNTSVTGVDGADFAITATGVTGASVSSVNGSGSSYVVTVATGAGSGTLRLDVADNDTIIDAVNVPLGGPGDNADFTTGQVYTIDKTPPAVSTIEAISGTLVDITFTETSAMGSGVLTPANYTVTGDGTGTVPPNPTSVALRSGNIYRLTWGSGSMVNGQPITITVIGVQDTAGNTISGSNSASNTALPVTLSGFTLE